MITVKSLASSHNGKVREHNEDAVYADDQRGLWIVADGMGGHASGEVASQLTVDTIATAIANKKTLQEAIIMSHQAILSQAQENPNQKGMGTTVVAAQRFKTGFKIAWVGDSRINLITDRLQQLSIDHSFVQDMVSREILTAEEAQNHPQKNLLVRSLGMEERRFKVDELMIFPKSSGILLLVSDGVSDYLQEQELQTIFKQTETLAKNMADIEQAVLNTEAADNFSVVAIEFKLDKREKWQNKLKWKGRLGEVRIPTNSPENKYNVMMLGFLTSPQPTLVDKKL